LDALTKLTQSNERVAQLLEEKNTTSKYKLPLQSHLAEPFQRLPRYQILLESLLRVIEKQPLDSKIREQEIKAARAALSNMSELNSLINDTFVPFYVSERRTTVLMPPFRKTMIESMMEWQRKVGLSRLNLLEAGRSFVRSFPAEIFDQHTDARTKSIAIVVLTDHVLLISNSNNPKEDDVLDIIHVLFCAAYPLSLPDSSLIPRRFVLLARPLR
jgi:hypothetical protein